MAHQLSSLEKKNADWFLNDSSRHSLFAITITAGSIRGLSDCRIEFRYPISAIAGKNGSGKSTLLALAACAFHNEAGGWRLPDRRLPYYTLSDFFIQAAEDVPVDGISIAYEIFSDAWVPDENIPAGVGVGTQYRWKNQGGKWNDYSTRLDRPVAFLGIERVVPHAERSVYRSYRYSFSNAESAGWEERVREAVSKVLGAQYTEFEVRSHGKYRLPVVRRNGSRYSGFNMGAGEKALFEVFAALFAAPDGSLFLIDEIELGLHEAAQRMYIRQLSEVCLKKKIQIICTTHSPTILESLPLIGRFLIQAGERTEIISGVSSALAAGRLGDAHSGELDVYVEDQAARILLEVFSGYSLLRRIRVVHVGSHSAVMHQVAAKYIEDSPKNCIAILDGDQRKTHQSHIKKFVDYLGGFADDDAKEWGSHRIFFLPGSVAPEHWVFDELRKCERSQIAQALDIDDVHLLGNALDCALAAEAHSSIHEFCRVLGLGGDKFSIWKDCCKALKSHAGELKQLLLDGIHSALNLQSTGPEIKLDALPIKEKIKSSGVTSGASPMIAPPSTIKEAK